MTDAEARRTQSTRLSGHAVERLLCEIWSGYFGRQVAPDDDFFELGGDSLAMIDVVAVARERGLAVRSSVALRNSTPARLAASLTTGNGASADDSRWIARLSRPARPGCACSACRMSARARPRSTRGSSTCRPRSSCARSGCPDGRAGLAEPLMDDWREVVGTLERALAPLLDLPFVLVGHCSGSVLAYEFSRRLRAAGSPAPELVVLSSTEGPAVRRIDDPLHLLPRDELLRRVVGYGGMASQVLDDPDLMAMFERILRADYQVIERCEYSAGPPLDVPITVIGGRRDEFVTPADLATWYAETTAEFSLHLLDAGHYVLREAGALIADLVGDLIRGCVRT